MDKRAFIKPLKTVVHNPATGLPLPKNGTFVVLNKYWRKLISVKDIEVVENVALPESPSSKNSRTKSKKLESQEN